MMIDIGLSFKLLESCYIKPDCLCMSLAVIFRTMLEGGGDQGWGLWVWGDSHGPVILLYILSTIW